MRKVDFMNLALENISCNRSIYTSVNFLQRLILTYPRDSQSNRQQYGSRDRPEVVVETRERII